MRLGGAYELLDSPQQDGANVQCRARVRVTKFTPADEYFLTMLYVDDDAKNRADIRFALNPNNPSVEVSPVVLIDTADGGDTRQVEVDVLQRLVGAVTDVVIVAREQGDAQVCGLHGPRAIEHRVEKWEPVFHT